MALPALAIYASARIRRLESQKTTVGPGAAPAPPQSPLAIHERLDAIEKRLAVLERQAQGTKAAPEPAAPTLPRPAPAPSRTVVLPPPRPAQAAGSDLESVLAEHWLNYFGIIAILFAAAFFIKYAFDSHWVGPRGRVEVGLAAGALVLFWSHRLMRRGYRYFSEGMAGLGSSVLYLSIWGGWHYYHLFSAGAALAAMAAVTAVTAAIAIGRDSQRLIVMALAGGFVSPILLNTGREHEFVLFGYNAVLAAGMIGVERVRRWPWLPLLTFFSIELYFWAWYTAFYSRPRLWLTLAFAALFFLIFATLPALRGRQRGRLARLEWVVVTANLGFFLIALWVLLRPNHRWLLTAAFLGLGAAHLAQRRILPRESLRLRRLTSTLALLSASLAIPARLDHQWITIAWAVEATVLVWAGARAGSWRERLAGLLLLAVVAYRLTVLEIPAHLFLWNARMGTFALCVGCFAMAAVFLKGSADGMRPREESVRGILLVAVSGYSLMALSLEAWDLFGRLAIQDMQHRAAQQMALSVLWTLFATGLIILGIVRKSPLLRWEALALFALTVAKVFLHDLASLERFYRILSFLVLGILLLVVSFLYQRRTREHKDATAAGPVKKTG